MRRNLESTKGLVFSGQLLLDLTEAGMLREEAYRLVQTKAMEAWHNDGDFETDVRSSLEISSILSKEKLDQAFSAERQLRNLKIIFSRVFQNQKIDG
jgi:adenylosuccinate lyase